MHGYGYSYDSTVTNHILCLREPKYPVKKARVSMYDAKDWLGMVFATQIREAPLHQYPKYELSLRVNLRATSVFYYEMMLRIQCEDKSFEEWLLLCVDVLVALHL